MLLTDNPGRGQRQNDQHGGGSRLGEHNGQSAVEPIQSEWCTDGLRQINKWRDGAKNSVWGKTVDGVTNDINVDVVHGAFNIFGANNSVL